MAKKPSEKPGEVNGPKTSEQKAAEKAPSKAKKTNPVAEATEIESKDPYAEGKHIANPEPNNGKGEDPEAFDKKAQSDEATEGDELDESSADLVADQEERDAEASTPSEGK